MALLVTPLVVDVVVVAVVVGLRLLLQEYVRSGSLSRLVAARGRLLYGDFDVDDEDKNKLLDRRQ